MNIKKNLYIYLFLFLLILFPVKISYSFWIWTPETNKWENPKYSVKETPQDQLAVGMGFFNEGLYKKAIKEFEKLIKYYPRSREASEAQYYIALCYEKQNNLYQAYKQFQMVIDKYPFSERSADVVQKQFDIGVALMEQRDEKNKFLQSVSLKETEIVDIFRQVIKNAPYSDLAPLAQYKIAVYMTENQLYQEARDEFEKVVNNYPESEWAKAARYQIALSDAKRSTDAPYDQKITKAAVEGLEEFVDDFPDSDLANEAESEISRLREKEAENNFLIAQFYEKQKNYQAAKIYYQSIVDDYRKTSWASKALKRISEIIQTEK